MANLELVVVLEEKTSVRVREIQGVCVAFDGEVAPGVMKVFRRETLIPKEEAGELCMRTGPVLLQTGGMKVA
jgi:hypothetical protein